jgi:hypothetical protein
MLAVLTEERFSSEEWLFEGKLDGERCRAFRRGGELRLLSRTRKQLNGTYPELAEPLVAQACEDFVVDGEVVAFEGRRRASRACSSGCSCAIPPGRVRAACASSTTCSTCSTWTGAT